MSDPDYDTAVVREAHRRACALLRASECLASVVPGAVDVRVQAARLGFPLPRERVARLCQLAGLPLADAPAERDATRARRG